MDDKAPKSIWGLYSGLRHGKKHNAFNPTATKLTRRAVILFAFPFSGSDVILSSITGHDHLFVCEDICLLPFETFEVRNSVLSSGNLTDGLNNTVQTLRNVLVPTAAHDLFFSVNGAYRAVQEWCAPRVLVDWSEAYSAVPQECAVAAANITLRPDYVHLVRNPRGCLGQYSQARPNDLIDIEQKYTDFTSSMLDLAAVKVRYEDLSTKNDEHPLNALFLHLGVPLHSAGFPSGDYSST